MYKIICVVFVFAFTAFLFPLEAKLLRQQGKGVLEEEGVQLVLNLQGTPYEMGYQHGYLLKELVAQNIDRFIDQKILPGQNLAPIKQFLEAIPSLLPHIPETIIEELKGLADGAGIAYEKILLLNLFPEMFHCSGLTVSGQASKNGELYHVRVLDYGVGQNLQDTAVLMIIKPEGKIPFVNVTYAGFIGCITGMNAEQIALGEIGGRGYGQWNGLPMAFLLRIILENARTLDQVKDLLSQTPRTCEYYYLFSDGKDGQAIGVYATPQQLHFIQPGSTYALFDLANQSAEDNKTVLTDLFLESSPYQTIIYQDQKKEQIKGLIHQQLADCVVLTGFSHPRRYSVMLERLEDYYGQVNVEALQSLIKGPAARPTNLHNAIFAPRSLELWLAHAGPEGEKACDQPYQYFSLKEWLKRD